VLLAPLLAAVTGVFVTAVPADKVLPIVPIVDSRAA
jgi:hypothetical protein